VTSASLLDPKAASIVVVGDARQFLPALRQAHPDVEVIPAAAVDLDTPKLR
jgi:zinc protease